MVNTTFEDITFWGSNIPNELDFIMKTMNEKILESFPSDELKKAYLLGVNNTIDILEQHLRSSITNDSITFYYPEATTTEEMSEEEICNWLETIEE